MTHLHRKVELSANISSLGYIQFFSNTPWIGNITASKSLEGKFCWKVWQCLRYEQIPVLIGGGWEAFLSCNHVAAVQEINLLPDCLLLGFGGGASIPPVHKHHHNRRIILHVMAWLFFHGPLYSDACCAFSFNTGILGHPNFKLLFCLANFCFHFEGMKHLRNLKSKNSPHKPQDPVSLVLESKLQDSQFHSLGPDLEWNSNLKLVCLSTGKSLN